MEVVQKNCPSVSRVALPGTNIGPTPGTKRFSEELNMNGFVTRNHASPVSAKAVIPINSRAAFHATMRRAAAQTPLREEVG